MDCRNTGERIVECVYWGERKLQSEGDMEGGLSGLPWSHLPWEINICFNKRFMTSETPWLAWTYFQQGAALSCLDIGLFLSSSFAWGCLESSFLTTSSPLDSISGVSVWWTIGPIPYVAVTWPVYVGYTRDRSNTETWLLWCHFLLQLRLCIPGVVATWWQAELTQLAV